MRLKLRLLLLVGLLFILAGNAVGQTFTGTQADSIQSGASEVYLWEYSSYPRYIEFRSLKAGFSSDPSAFFRKIYRLPASYSFHKTREDEDGLGQKHLRFQVVYKNHPIDGSTITAHLEGGNLKSIDAALFDMPAEGRIGLSPEEAIDKALLAKPASPYIWEIPGEEALIKDLQHNERATYYPNPVLSWFPKNAAEPGGEWVLCYTFKIYGIEPLFHDQVYLHASTGELLFSENLIHDINITGTAITRYSGTRTIHVDSMSNGLFRLRDSSLGAKIETYDLNRSTNYSNAVDFIDSNNTWNNVDTLQDEVATDAHWGAEKTYRYFLDNFGRQSFDNQGAAIRSYVHYSNNYNNAFWNGYVMTYGDGNGTTFTPLTSLDVCGHEIGHAVTTHTANLIYQNESGALNESFSDIFGNSIEFENKSNADWKIGEDITPNGSGLRNMQKPKVKGDPDTYKGQYWYGGTGDNGGVHTNSGVQNFWYYLLCDGDTGTNDNQEFFSVDSLGQAIAQQITYRSLSTYLSRFSNYADARYFSILAAKDLYGACSREVIATTNAWHAAGVGDLFDSTVVRANFSSEQFLCFNTGAIPFLNYSENATSYIWDFGDGTTDTSEHPAHVFASYGFFDVQLIAFNCFGNGSDTLLKTQQILIDSTADICHALIMPTGAIQNSEYCQGLVYDDGGESSYSDLHESFLSISTPGADSIGIVFLEFDYEKDYDYLYLYEGADSSGNLLGKLTGMNLPFNGDTLILQGNAITIRHTSDPAVVGTGFKLQYFSYRPEITAIAPRDTLVCRGDSVQLRAEWNAPDSNSLAFYWLDSSSQQSIVSGKSVWLKPDSQQTFALVLLDACSFSRDTAYFTLSMRDSLQASILNDTLVCSLENFQIHASGSGGLSSGYSFSWPELNLLGASQTVAFPSDTLLHVVLNDGCTLLADTAEMLVQVRAPLSVQLAGDTVACYAGNAANFSGIPSGGDSLSYEYYFMHGSSPGQNGLMVAPFVSSWVHVALGDQCSRLLAEDSLFLRVISSIEYELSADTQLCYGQSIPIQTQIRAADFASLQITWNKGGNAGDSSFTSDPLQSESYILQLSDRCNTIEDTTIISLLAPLTLDPESDTTICFQESLYKNIVATGGDAVNYQYNWSDGYTGEFRQWQPGFTQGYEVILNDGCSLADTLQFTVTLRDPLSIDLGADITVCDAHSFMLRATATGGNANNYSYYWNGVRKVDSATFKADTSGWYVVRLSDKCSPDVSNSIYVTVQSPAIPALLVSDTLLCTDEEVTIGLSSSVNQVNWTTSDGTDFTTESWTYSWTKAGYYSIQVEIEDIDGCKADTVFTNRIQVVNAAKAQMSLSSRTLELGEDELSGNSIDNNAVNWFWNIEDGSTYSTGRMLHIFQDTGRYAIQLEVEDIAGCSDIAFDTVLVYDKAVIWFPDAFTPNKDGVNEDFAPVFLDLASGSYKIYNRWGAVVYACEDILSCSWDGGDNEAGIYLIVFQGISKRGERLSHTGSIHLIR